ncbi:E7 [Macaca mulatta papillomavirus 5]|uniref:E7 n=1 Tax=Macaca mulatta papillomavirus 5 TaxID=2364645 RepID=UPI000EB6862F|nr:E7 [Macaca mulatta papillomavirus 5]AYD74599.1 E7 [Macaca mulatta papillomavirus 5]
MQGEAPTLKDIVLEFEEDILPVNLLSEEDLSQEEELEEPDRSPYSVVTHCDRCAKSLRIVVIATKDSVRSLETLLFGSLSLLCPPCARSLRHGR